MKTVLCSHGLNEECALVMVYNMFQVRLDGFQIRVLLLIVVFEVGNGKC